MLKLGEFVVMLLTMIIVLEFLGIPTGLSVIAESFGLSINARTAELVSVSVETSEFWGFIFENTGIFVLLSGGGAIIIGLFSRTYDTSLVVLPLIVATAGLLISTFGALIIYTRDLGQPWMTALMTTIFGALAIAFMWSSVDYFVGR